MAKLRNIALAFADGFAPLEGILGGIQRPGSHDNLISNSAYPSVEILARKLQWGRKLKNDGVSGSPGASRSDARELGNQGVRTLVSSLRAKALEIESAAALSENEPLGTTHGQ